MTDLDDTEESGVSVTVQRGRGRRGSGVESDPVQNTAESGPIPLFPDMDRDSRHIVVGLEITKLTMPHEGYRGTIPPSSTLEAIGRRFGDGRYNIHAVNSEGKVLRRRNDVPIAVGAESSHSGPARIMAPAAPDMDLLRFQAAQHEKDAERIATFAKESNQQNREMTKSHLEMVRSEHEAQTARDREYFAAQSAQNREFFQSILSFMGTSHSQIMERQEAQHQYMLTLLEHGHQRALAASDPMMLLALFKSGLEFGQNIDSPDSNNPMIQAMQMGLGGIKEIKEMMMLKQGGLAGTMAARRIAAGGPPSPNPAKPVPKKAGPTGPVQPATPAPAAESKVLGKLIQVRQALEAKGIDFEDYIDDVIAHLQKMPDEPEGADVDEPEGEEEPNQESARPT